MKLPELFYTPIPKRNEWELWVAFMSCCRYDWHASNCGFPTTLQNVPEYNKYPSKYLCLAVVSVVVRSDVVCLLLFR